MTILTAERTTAANTGFQELLVLGNDQLLPSSSALVGPYPLSGQENRAMIGALKSIGAEKSRDTRHFNGDAHILSAGAAVKAGADGLSSARVSFDLTRGRGALADGNGYAVAAETASRGFLRGMGRFKPEQLITSYDATEALRQATASADRALGKAKRNLGESYDPASASLSGFQFLYKGRLAVTQTGNTSIFVLGPDGICRQVNPNYGQETGQLYGASSRRQARAGSGGRFDVIDLAAGTNIVILANSGAIEGKNAESIEMALDGLELDPDDPESGAIIARHLAGSLAGSGKDAAVMAVAVDIAERADKRSLLRKSLDPLRVSTALFAAMTRISKPGLSRRELYEEPTKRGKNWRRMARAVDLAAAAVGAAAVYNISKQLEVDIDFLANNGVIDDLVTGLGFGQPGHGNNSTALAPSILLPGFEDLPGDTAAPPPEAPPAISELPDNRTAYGDDPATDRASNVSDWSARAIEHYGEQEGLKDVDIQKITSDWKNIASVNEALYADNKPVADHPLHYLIEGKTYDTSGQNEAAHQLVLDWKTDHMPAEPAPEAPVPVAEQPEVPEPPPVINDPVAGEPQAPIEPQETADSSNPWQNDLIPVAAAIVTTGATVGLARAVSQRRKKRRLTEIATREARGEVRSHNSKYRKILDSGEIRPKATDPEPSPFAEVT